MSRADRVFIENCRQILSGKVDKSTAVRPRWEDGTPAYTIKKFGIVNRYDLAEEFPILTIRRTYLKSAVDELLWIWQKKSNNVNDLKGGIWDSWADESGSIGKAYGYQMGKKYNFAEGEFDQVDYALYLLKNSPNSRRIICNMFNHADLKEMNLQPCAYSMTFNVDGRKTQCYTQPALAGHAGGKQLERMSVLHAGAYVCTSERTKTGRIRARDS